MTSLQLRIAAQSRALLPLEDEDLGRHLLDRVDVALRRGPPSPSVVVVLEDAVWFADLRPVLARRFDVRRFLASLAGMEGVVALGILGGMRRHRPGGTDPVAGVFLEWSDGRWWAAWRELGEDGRALPTDTDGITRARDGEARPGGLGGWFALARFEGLRAHLDPSPKAPPPPLDN